MEVIIGLLVLVALARLWTRRGEHRIAAEPPWAQPAQTTAARPVARGGAGSVAIQLARIEGRQVARSEAFVVGIALWVLILLLFFGVWAGDSTGFSWRATLVYVPAYSLPLAGMSLVAVAWAALRSRRDGTDELYAALPANPAIRAWGHVGSAWAPLLAEAAFVAIAIVLAPSRFGSFGAIDGDAVGDVATGFVLIAIACMLGVALARWLPHPLVPVVALLALAFGGTALGGIGGHHWSAARQLSIWPRYPDHDLLFAARPVWWHAAYLGALGGLVAVAAVARHQRGRAILLLAAATATVAVSAAVIETRPMSAADADRIAALVTDPLANEACRTDDGLTLCAYRDYERITATWANQLGGPMAAVPPARRAQGFRVLQRLDSLDRLDPAVRRRIDATALARRWAVAPNTWNGDFDSLHEHTERNRLALGLWSVSLPLSPLEGRRPCATGGQARGVVALWVAAQGLDSAAARGLATADFSGRSGDKTDRLPASWSEGYAWGDPFGALVPPVLWSAPDLAAARALLGRPADTVRARLWSDWPRITDPSTTSDHLLAQFGLDPVGPPGAPPEGTEPCR